jgi:hypothetical protein
MRRAEDLIAMRTVLLGPNGQLGSDIRAANVEMEEALSIMPVGR